MNDLGIEILNNTCEFSYDRDGETIWGTCLFTMEEDLDRHFDISVENVTAYCYAGETEIPYKLSENEIYLLCDGIFDVANDLCLWERQQEAERSYWDELNSDEKRYENRL